MPARPVRQTAYIAYYYAMEVLLISKKRLKWLAGTLMDRSFPFLETATFRNII
jgi:hypothetical protein